MKTVLIIDESPLFREYLKTKLADHEMEVETVTAGNNLEALSKMRIVYPDLIILDYPLSNRTYMEVLKEKKLNPNTVKVPVILMAQKIDQKKILDLIPFGVKKVFTKPIKIDGFFKTLSNLLGVQYKIDESPGIVDVHVNDEIIFIELAKGLNEDKLDLLSFKIKELIDLYEIKFPRIIVMCSDINLKGAEIHKLEKLLNILLKISKAKHRAIRILTNDGVIKKFIADQKEYAEFMVASSLPEALDGLVMDRLPPNSEKNSGEAVELLEELGDRILGADEPRSTESMQFRFEADFRTQNIETLKEAIRNLRIGAVDDDYIAQVLIKNAFKSTGCRVTTYSNGMDFLQDPENNQFDLVFLDIMMPQLDGFEVLNELRGRNYQIPVIVLSALSKREMVIKAFQMGVKSYLIKPLNPGAIFKKTIEILKPNF
jgi:DNA-binding response OmpR family regulator